MNMKSILVPVEQHEVMTSTLQTALLLAKTFDSYIEGFALFPAMVELYALDPGGPLPIEFNENEVEMAKEARGLFENFMNSRGVAKSSKIEGTLRLSDGWTRRRTATASSAATAGSLTSSSWAGPHPASRGRA